MQFICVCEDKSIAKQLIKVAQRILGMLVACVILERRIDWVSGVFRFCFCLGGCDIKALLKYEAYS